MIPPVGVYILYFQKTFSSLTNIIKLDLSKNQLEELPENFGDLLKLKHLDLYNNKLQHLPLTFSKLKQLRWLDLKDNPLVPAIKDTAGECLDNKDCQKCARNIVQFYIKLQEKINQEKEVREANRQKSKMNNLHKLKSQDKKLKKLQKKKSAPVQLASEKSNLNNKKEMLDANKKQKHVKPNLLKWIFLLMLFMFITISVWSAAGSKLALNIVSNINNVWQASLTQLPEYLVKIAKVLEFVVIESYKLIGIGTINTIQILQQKIIEISLDKTLENIYVAYDKMINVIHNSI